MVDDRGDDLDLHDQLAVALSERVAAARGVLLSDALARQYALQALLTLAEAAAIVQWRSPLLRGTLPGPAYVDEFEGEVGRLLHDVRQAHLPNPCTPIELVAWANAIPVALPPAFLVAVNDGQLLRGTTIPANASQISARANAPDMAGATAVPGALRGRGQINTQESKVRSDRDPDLQARVERIADDIRRKTGRYPSKAHVSRKLPKDLGIEPQTVERRTRNTWTPRKKRRVAA